MKSFIRLNMSGVQVALGIPILIGTILAAWFNALERPMIYDLFVCSLGLWIGLWPIREPKLGGRLFTAWLGSMLVCAVLTVISLAVSHIKLGGDDDGGPVLYVLVAIVMIGLPVTILSMLVAMVAPLIRRRMTSL
jgi:hypothetical protein